MDMTFGRVFIPNRYGLDNTVDMMVSAMEMMGYSLSDGRNAHQVSVLGRATDRFLAVECDMLDDNHTQAMDAFATQMALRSKWFGLVMLCMESKILWIQLNDGVHQALVEIGSNIDPEIGAPSFTPGCWHVLMRSQTDRAKFASIRNAEYERAEDAVAPLAALLRFDAKSAIYGSAAGSVLWQGSIKRLASRSRSSFDDIQQQIDLVRIINPSQTGKRP